jgi:hypothetical protein
MDFTQLLYSPQAAAVQPVPTPTAAPGVLQPADIQAAPRGPTDFNTAVNNPVQSIMSKAPATSPEEVAVRKSQWSQVLDAFQKDPNLQATLLYMGTQMMQPVAPGQTDLGHLGRAMQGGMGFLAGKEEVDRKRQMEDKRFDLETRQAESTIKNKDTDTEAKQYGLEEQRKTEGLRMQKLDLDMQRAQAEISNIADERDLRKVQRRIALMTEEIKTMEASEFMRPEAANMREKLRRLEVESKEAEINYKRKATQVAGTYAATEIDKAVQDKIADPQWRASKGLPEGTPMETYRNLARDEATKAHKTYGGSVSASVQEANRYEDTWKRANPQAATESKESYDQRAALALKAHMDNYLKYFAATQYELPPGYGPQAAPTPQGQAGKITKWGKDKNGNPVPLNN